MAEHWWVKPLCIGVVMGVFSFLYRTVRSRFPKLPDWAAGLIAWLGMIIVFFGIIILFAFITLHD